MSEKGRADDPDLRTLAILHFGMALLCLAGTLLIIWQYRRVHDAFLDVTAWKKQKGGGASLQEFFEVFNLFYLVPGAIVAACCVGNLLSGILITRRKGRFLSLFVACVNCIMVPIGTLLGAFTWVVLLRDSVRAAYEAKVAKTAVPRPGRKGSPR